MVNPPRSKGTAAETAVVCHLRAAGIRADRRPLTGSRDTGDIWAAGGRIVIEVKTRTTHPVPRQIRDWLAQLDTETVNAQAAGAPVDVSALVVKRPGSGPNHAADWYAYLPIPDAAHLLGADTWQSLQQAGAWVMVDLATLTALLLINGYGTETQP
ncbi:MAG: hypothetical protein WCF04_00175 [Candidatus Nanopelagicales bacterium]